jgi:hypothetical protein
MVLKSLNSLEKKNNSKRFEVLNYKNFSNLSINSIRLVPICVSYKVF